MRRCYVARAKGRGRERAVVLDTYSWLFGGHPPKLPWKLLRQRVGYEFLWRDSLVVGEEPSAYVKAGRTLDIDRMPSEMRELFEQDKDDDD